MKFLYGLGGANVPVIKDFELSYASMNVKAGEVVKCDSNGKISTNVGDAILGVVAENHTGKKDILNARDTGNMVRVDITKNGVYRADAPRLVVSATGTATTVLTRTSELSTIMKESLLVLIEKGEGSANTDAIGTARRISNYSSTSPENIVTVASGSISYEGDVYAIVPYIGGEYPVSEDCTTICYGVGCGGKVKVVGRDIKNATIDVVFKETIFD